VDNFIVVNYQIFCYESSFDTFLKQNLEADCSHIMMLKIMHSAGFLRWSLTTCLETWIAGSIWEFDSCQGSQYVGKLT